MMADASEVPQNFLDNVTIETLRGELYGLCKDQHGCRFLQKRLENHSAEDIRLIFEETNEHIIELMTGK